MGPNGRMRSLAQQRHERIVHEVRLRGAVRVADLAALLHVSDMTVRRDLDALDLAGRVIKVHGGATTPADQASNEPGFDTKALRNTNEKAAIASAAAGLVGPGAAIGISAGTTTWRLAGELLEVPELTIVTNSVRVADVFNNQPRSDRTVILTGGVRTPSDALVGPVAVAALARLHVDLLFIGVHGMSESAGFSTPNLHEAETNRMLFQTADRRIVLADHTKWDVTGLSTFADLGDADVVVTNDLIDPSAADVLSAHVERVSFVTTQPGPIGQDHNNQPDLGPRAPAGENTVRANTTRSA